LRRFYAPFKKHMLLLPGQLHPPSNAGRKTAANDGIIETFYVRFLGTDALVGLPRISILVLMTMMSNGGTGAGVASAVARAIGSGRRADADALLLHAVVLGATFGLAFCAAAADALLLHAVVLGATFGLAFCAAALVWGLALYRALGGDGGALQTAFTYPGLSFSPHPSPCGAKCP